MDEELSKFLGHLVAVGILIAFDIFWSQAKQVAGLLSTNIFIADLSTAVNGEKMALRRE